MERRTHTAITMKPLFITFALALLNCVHAQEPADDNSYPAAPLPKVPVLAVGDVYALPVEPLELVIPDADNSWADQEQRGPSVEPVPRLRILDKFHRDLTSKWNAPQGEYMNTLLKQIEAAEESGDAETYRRLTETYRIWAEKYLVRGVQRGTRLNP